MANIFRMKQGNPVTIIDAVFDKAGKRLPAIIDELKESWKNMMMKRVTWREIYDLREKGKLVPGKSYRITDYHCTTAQEDTQSADHQFDIIVTADTADTLNENARACLHDGDTYFSSNGADLSAWELKYSLDNKQWSMQKVKRIYTDDELWFESKGSLDIDGETLYLWYNVEFDSGEGGTIGYLATRNEIPEVNDGASVVDVENEEIISEHYSMVLSVSNSTNEGTGTITWMKDERCNECSYDFKNIQFKRYEITECKSCESLVGKYGILGVNRYSVDEENFVWCYTFNEWDVGENSYIEGDASLTKRVYSNRYAYETYLRNNVSFGYFHSNTFGNGCSSNTFENNCYYNTFGNYCYYNTFGIGCYYNTFGNYCYYNTFGNYCTSNTFGIGCYYNTFGNYCYYNKFGNDLSSNTFGNDCYYNTFGNYCTYNTFGNYCSSNTFGNDCSSNTFGNYMRLCSFEDGVHYVTTNCSTGSGAYLRNMHVLNGTQGTSSSNKLTISITAKRSYCTYVGKNASGVLKIWCPADLVN